MNFKGRCYRGHDPAWSFSPLSGAGADQTGGRFNRKNEPTLYLSLDVMTSFGECTQGFTSRLHPLTMCEYDVDCDGIVDLRDDVAREARNVGRDELACGWLSSQLAGTEAPSWLIVDGLKAAGFNGMLVPSFVPGATDANVNLVLWRWGRDPPLKVDVYDPSGRLPRDQLSWRKLTVAKPYGRRATTTVSLYVNKRPARRGKGNDRRSSTARPSLRQSCSSSAKPTGRTCVASVA